MGSKWRVLITEYLQNVLIRKYIRGYCEIFDQNCFKMPPKLPWGNNLGYCRGPHLWFWSLFYSTFLFNSQNGFKCFAYQLHINRREPLRDWLYGIPTFFIMALVSFIHPNTIPSVCGRWEGRFLHNSLSSLPVCAQWQGGMLLPQNSKCTVIDLYVLHISFPPHMFLKTLCVEETLFLSKIHFHIQLCGNTQWTK